MPTDTITTTRPRLASLTRVDVLSFGPMRDEAVAHYCSLDPDRGNWPDEKKKRLVISTECKWGRVNLENNQVYMLSEKGEGPRKPLSDKVTCRVALFASMDASPTEEGWYDTQAFAKVDIDDVRARELPTIGGVQLEEFIKTRMPEYEAAYNEWRTLLLSAREKITGRRAKAQQSGFSPAVETPQISQPQEKEDSAPPVAEGAPPIRQKPPGGRVRI